MPQVGGVFLRCGVYMTTGHYAASQWPAIKSSRPIPLSGDWSAVDLFLPSPTKTKNVTVSEEGFMICEQTPGSGQTFPFGCTPTVWFQTWTIIDIKMRIQTYSGAQLQVLSKSKVTALLEKVYRVIFKQCQSLLIWPLWSLVCYLHSLPLFILLILKIIGHCVRLTGFTRILFRARVSDPATDKEHDTNTKAKVGTKTGGTTEHSRLRDETCTHRKWIVLLTAHFLLHKNRGTTCKVWFKAHLD